MRMLSLIGLAVLFTMIYANGTMNINSLACDVFTGKFGTTNSADGTGTTKLAFGGNVSIADGSADAIVKFQYSDDDFYNNSTFYGLVTEDGLKPEQTCLDLRIYKYTSEKFNDPIRVNDLTITSATNAIKKWRYYQITFKGSEFETRLIRTESQYYYLYTGYYSLAYYLQGTEQVQYTHLFQFTIRVNKLSKSIASTSFYPLSDSSRMSCSTTGEPTCDVTAVSTLQFCADENCTKFTTTPNIHLNDQIYLLHNITTEGLRRYTLSNTQIYYVSSGLTKEVVFQTPPVYSAGQAIYVIKATLAWTNLQIQATTTLVAPAKRILAIANLRYLEDVTTTSTAGQDSAQASTIETCIKAEGSETCPTCDEICAANDGDAPSICKCTQGPSSSQFILVPIILGLLFVF